MTSTSYYCLDSVTILDVTGADAAKIVNNLATNDIAGLSEGHGCESFVTDVRGKTLGHVIAFRQQDRYRLIGAGGQAETLSQHIDRYTISEDARPVAQDDLQAIVLPPGAATLVAPEMPGEGEPCWQAKEIGGVDVDMYSAPWLGWGTVVLVVGSDGVETVADWLKTQGLNDASMDGFHHARTHQGFPWYGIDVDVSNLPQEAERNDAAISLTKGCYLGQETVARLDALGQVQKKLVRWSIRGEVPAAGAKLEADGKTVGRITSIASGGEQDAMAIGYARRSHFDPGSEANGVDEMSGKPFHGRVCEPS